VNVLTSRQIINMSTMLIAAFSTTQIPALSLTAFASLQTAQLVNFTGEQMGAITATQLAKLSAVKLRSFLGEESAIAFFAPSQTSALTSAQLSALNA
jgi:hypothetical protein